MKRGSGTFLYFFMHLDVECNWSNFFVWKCFPQPACLLRYQLWEVIWIWWWPNWSRSSSRWPDVTKSDQIWPTGPEDDTKFRAMTLAGEKPLQYKILIQNVLDDQLCTMTSFRWSYLISSDGVRLAKLYTGYMAHGYIARHTWLYSHWLFSHVYMAI